MIRDHGWATRTSLPRLRLASFLLLLLVFPASASAQGQLPPPIYYTQNFNFDEVEVNAFAARLRSFGIPVPVALRGTVTVNLAVGIPLNRLASGRAYRFQGTLSSPRLGIEDYLLGDVTATLSFENGVLTLPRLEGRFLDPANPDLTLGRFAGEAAASLLPLGDLEAELNVQNVDVQLFDQFTDESVVALATGTIDGFVSLTAPVDSLDAAETYTATARLSSPSLSYAGLRLVDAAADIRLDGGTARLTSVTGQLFEAGSDVLRGAVRGDATAELIPLGDISIRGGIDRLDLALLPRLANSPESQITGIASLDLATTAPIRIVDELAAWSGEGRLSVARAVVGQQTIESAEVAFKMGETTITADPVTIIAEGVPLRGRVAVRLAETVDRPRGWSASLTSDAAEVSDLLTLLAGAAPAGSSGTASLDIDALGSLDGETWQIDGTVTGSAVHVAGFRVGQLSHRLQVTTDKLLLSPTAEANPTDLLLRRLSASYSEVEDAVSLEDLSIDGWNGELHGQVYWSLLEDGRHRAEVDWSGFEFVFRGDALGATERMFQATTSGHVDWTAPASELSRPAAHAFNLRAEVEDLRSDDVALGALRIAVDAADVPWQLSGSGHLLEIPAEVTAVLRVAPDVSWENLLLSPGEASLLAGPLPIDQMIARGSAVVQDEQAGREQAEPVESDTPWRGTAALRVNTATAAGGASQTRALLSIADLAYGDSPVADELAIGTQVEWIDGLLRLSDIRGRLSNEATAGQPLRISGIAVAELSPVGDLALELGSPAVDLAIFSRWLPPDLRPLDGLATATLRAAAPLGQLADIEAWKGVAYVSVADLQAGERQFDTASAEVVLQESWLTANHVELAADGVALEGRAATEIDPATGSLRRWEAHVQAPLAAVEDVIRLVSGTTPADTAGAVSFDLDASGNFSDGTWTVGGEISGEAIGLADFQVGSLAHRLRINPTELELARLPSADPQIVPLSRLSASYSIDERHWTLDDFRLDGWGGTLAGTATLSRTDQERHRAEFAWADLEIPIPGEWVGLGDTVVQTSTLGTLEWSAPPAELSDPSAHRFALEAGVADIRIGEVALGDLQVGVDAMEEIWAIEGDGTLLGGPAQLTATLRAGEAASWEQLSAAPVEAAWVAGPMQIGRLFHLWQPDERAEDWTGQASLRWTAQSDGDAPLRSTAQLSIETLAYRNQSITDRLRIELASIGSRLDIRSVRGTYAGGRISGSGRWSVDPGPRQLALRLSSVDASRAFLPLTPDSGDWFRGLMSADMVIAGGDSLRMTGQMELRNGATFGIRSRSVRATVRGLVALPSLRWSLQLSNLRAFQGRGRVTGSVRLEQSLARPDRINLDSNFEPTDLDFQELIADQTGSSASSLGHGELTGTLTLSGRAIETIADIDGRLVARLGGTDAVAVPGLLSAQNYLGVLSIRNTQFTRGEIEARFRRGEMQINDLWLSSDQLRVWAEGRVSLRSGRLDVRAVAATGNFRENNTVILALAQRFALDAAMPIGLVTRVNDLLSDRVVRLAINGTYVRPNVRIEPAATLTQNAARFFLREAAGIAVPGAAVGGIGSNR